MHFSTIFKSDIVTNITQENVFKERLGRRDGWFDFYPEKKVNLVSFDPTPSLLEPCFLFDYPQSEDKREFDVMAQS